jgi:D-3-phosphoglycerate dehydrogenase
MSDRPAWFPKGAPLTQESEQPDSMSARWKVLVSAPYMMSCLDRFLPWFEAHSIEPVVPNVRERLEEAELMNLVGDIDGVVCGDDRFTERVLERARRLKVISKWGTGIDSIDCVAAERLGIQVYRTPGAFTEPVTDSVLGYILAFARGIPWSTEDLRSGRWQKYSGRALNECVLGIIGVGDIGKSVATRARSFGMRVLVNDIRPMDPDWRAAVAVEDTSLAKLLQESDFVSINCDLNPTSYHLLSSEEFALMKSTAVVINTARGPIIDEPALIEALESGAIAGAALDVFEDEPLSPDSRLCRMSNVLLAAHNANSSPRAWERVHENTLRNLLAGLTQPRRRGA